MIYIDVDNKPTTIGGLLDKLDHEHKGQWEWVCADDSCEGGCEGPSVADVQELLNSLVDKIIALNSKAEAQAYKMAALEKDIEERDWHQFLEYSA